MKRITLVSLALYAATYLFIAAAYTVAWFTDFERETRPNPTTGD